MKTDFEISQLDNGNYQLVETQYSNLPRIYDTRSDAIKAARCSALIGRGTISIDGLLLPLVPEHSIDVDAMVGREVRACASSLVSDILASNAGTETWDGDDLMSLCSRDDWETAVRESDAFLSYDDDTEEITLHDGSTGYTLIEACAELGKYPSNFQDEKEAFRYVTEDERFLAVSESGAYHLIDVETFDDWPEAADHLSIDPHMHEALEHYIVSNWLAEKLEAQGEMTGEVSGLKIWGRTGSGSMIACDSVIIGIWAELVS